MTLAIASVGSALSTIAFGLADPAWPVWSFVVLAAFAGFSVSGWNGVQIAEVARRSPPELIGETAAGAVILVFMANMLAPVAFAAFVAMTGRFDLAFLVCGVFSLVCLPLLYGMGPETSSSASSAATEPAVGGRARREMLNPSPEETSPNNEGVMYGELGLFIDGAWQKNGGGNKGEDVINPATEKPLAHLPHANKADLDEALEAAKKGFAVWRATSAYDRARSCTRPRT